MTEIEIYVGKELSKMIRELAKGSRMSREEAVGRAFEEGLRLAGASEQAWESLHRKAGVSDELTRTSKRILDLRQQRSSTDTAYARTNFESFETFNAVGHLLMLYNVFRSDVQNLSKMARDRGIEVGVDLKSTDIPGIKELLNRYLFRREKAKVAATSVTDEGTSNMNRSG